MSSARLRIDAMHAGQSWLDGDDELELEEAGTRKHKGG